MMRFRLAAGLIGLGLAILAIVSDDKRFAWAAIAVLSIALVLRLIARRRA
jgi:hypothetical protein